MNTKVLLDIFKINLGIRKTERVLLFIDTIKSSEVISSEDRIRRENNLSIAKTLYELGKPLCKEIIYMEYPALGSHGIEPPPELWKAAFGESFFREIEKISLFDKLLSKKISKVELKEIKNIAKTFKNEAVDAVIALSNYSTSHTNFRDLLTKCCKTRYASMPLFDSSMLDGAMCANWKEIAKKSKKIKEILDLCQKIFIQTPNGTQIEFLKGKRKIHMDTGILTKKGSFGNLPAGEVFLAPIEGTAKGSLVIEWAPTRKLSTPLILKVEDGKVVAVDGDEPYREELERKLNERNENRNIAELGIGTNEKAKKPDNILESEKILGTVHIALGDNSSFGGKIRTNFHQDFIFFNPTLYGIGEREKIKILENDKFLI